MRWHEYARPNALVLLASALIGLLLFASSPADAKSPKSFYRYKDYRELRRPYRPFLGAVELTLYDGEYVFLVLGNPGHYTKLRLNFQIDRSVMYSDLSERSQTYSVTDTKQTLGSDIFYIGQYKLRMPVVNDPNYANDRAFSSVHDAPLKVQERELFRQHALSTASGNSTADASLVRERLLNEARRVFDDLHSDDDDDDEGLNDPYGWNNNDALSRHRRRQQLQEEDDDDDGVHQTMGVIDDDDSDSSAIYSEYVSTILKGQDDRMESDNPSLFGGDDPDNPYVLQALSERTEANGDLALGPGSMLWRYWRNFTLSVDSLTLGSYNKYLQRDVHYRGPVIPILFYYPLWAPDTMFKRYYGNLSTLSASDEQRTPPWSPVRERQQRQRRDEQKSLVDQIMQFEESASFFEHRRRNDRLKLIERILSTRYRQFKSKSYVPRGAIVVLGKIDGRVYKIILNYQSYSTYIPRHLKSLQGFDIEFGNMQALLDELRNSTSSIGTAASPSHRRFATAWSNANNEGGGGAQKQQQQQQHKDDLYNLFVQHLMAEEHVERGRAAAAEQTTRRESSEPVVHDEFLEFHDSTMGLDVYNRDDDDDDSSVEQQHASVDMQQHGFFGTDDSGVYAQNTRSRTLSEFMQTHWTNFGKLLYDRSEELAVPYRQTCIDEYIHLGIDDHDRLGAVPRSQRQEKSHDAGYCTNTTSLYFSMSDHRIMLKNAFEYHVVFESPIDNVIMLGRHTLRHLVMFADLKELKVVLAPSYHYFIGSTANYYVCLLMTLLLASWWLVSANSHAVCDITNTHQLTNAISIMTSLQLIISLFCIAGSFILLKGYDIDRFLSHLVRTDYAGVQTYVLFSLVILLSLSNIFVNVLTMLRLLHYQKYIHLSKINNGDDERRQKDASRTDHHYTLNAGRRWKRIYIQEQARHPSDEEYNGAGVKPTNEERHRSAFVSAQCGGSTSKRAPHVYKLEFVIDRWLSTMTIRGFQTAFPALLVIWFCLLPHHQTLIDIGYLLFTSIALTMSSTLLAFDAFFHHKCYKSVVILGALISYAFLYVYNLLPIISLVWGASHAYRYTLALGFVMSVVFAPSVYFYSMYQKKNITNQPYKRDILMPGIVLDDNDKEDKK